MKKYLVTAIIIAAIVLPPLVAAQAPVVGLAIPVSIPGPTLPEGTLVCSGEQGFVPCSNPYDPSIYGVIVDTPPAAFDITTESNRYFILSEGRAVARVTASNGNIAVGSSITSSSVAGVGQLSTQNGYVIGSALEAFSPPNPADVGEIAIAINIHYTSGLSRARSNLLEVLRGTLAAPILEPLQSLRYFLAALIILISFTLGFIYFGRISRASIEAVGRNPLARRMIYLSVVTNVLINIVIVFTGLILAYFILIL